MPTPSRAPSTVSKLVLPPMKVRLDRSWQAMPGEPDEVAEAVAEIVLVEWNRREIVLERTAKGLSVRIESDCSSTSSVESVIRTEWVWLEPEIWTNETGREIESPLHSRSELAMIVTLPLVMSQ
jgi:hypothetical protein